MWFGVGFNATTMGNTPYTITVDGETGKITERRLGDHNPGKVIKPMISVLSNTVDKKTGLRTVVLSRQMEGITSEHFSFDINTLRIPFINALGSQATFSYHKENGSVDFTVVSSSVVSACVCGPRKFHSMPKVF